MNNSKIDPDGWSSFWIPASLAILFFMLIGLLAWSETRHIKSQVEENVNKSIYSQTQTEPVYVPKYDSATQAKIDKIEINRQNSHDHIDNLYDGELQDALDSTFNQ